MRKFMTCEKRVFPTGQGNIHYLLVHSPRRRTMAIQIKDNGIQSIEENSCVRVIVPNFVKDEQILAFWEENERWIVRQIERVRRNHPAFDRQ